METATRTHAKLIALTCVESKQIFAIGHDADSQTLAIQFRNYKSPDGSGGPLYHYSNVTEEDFLKLKHADSIGKHFGEHIKPAVVKYPYVRVDAVPADA